VRWHSVKGPFRRDFVVPPVRARYFVITRCTGFTAVTSKTYDVDQPRVTMELGVIAPQRNP
jgi:hypothetical protein